MLGEMMTQPLLISSLLTHAERHHGDAEIVSRRIEGDVHRYTYVDLASRARRVARSLARLGVSGSDRVGTLAWNGYRHLELYYGVSGSGAVLHTINPRLHIDQLAWIAQDAQDQVLFFDSTFLPLVRSLAERTRSIRHFVLLADRASMPADASIPGLLCYEELLAAEESDGYEWPTFDENTASGLCYTSGTTGNPKGVLYSHRSTLLHTLAAVQPDALGVGARDCILPVVPMFHINAWGMVYIAPMTGCKLVLPGAALDGESLHGLIEAEGVTFSAGVPTVWQGLLAYTRASGKRFSTMRRTGIGGSACPPAMIRAFRDEFDVTVLHAWGMTETSPLGTVGTPKRKHAALSAEESLGLAATQGRAVWGVDLRVVDDDGREIAWDSETPGHLQVRGHWVVERYFKHAGGDPLHEGWFPTGDVATMSSDGYMTITDRSKDVIKSGGEWIGSIEIENVAMSHPRVAMAACVGARHPKWDERPLLVVVRKPGAELTRDELIGFFEGKVAKWWTPDDVVFVEAIPLGATGKMLKTKLREQYGHYYSQETA